MKYTLHGFNQQKACELDLGLDELAILRWFIDFRDTDRMEHREIDGKVYYWVVYNKVLEDLPILKCNVRSVGNKFKNLEKAGILMHKTFKKGGTFSYYGIGEAYTLLIAGVDIFHGSQKIDEGVVKKLTNGSQKIDEGVVKKLTTKDSSIIDSSTKDYSIIDKNNKQYSDDVELNDAILSFMKFRKDIKKPMNDHTIDLLIKKLENMDPSIKNQIEILNQSMVNGWQGIFPLKENESKPKEKGRLDWIDDIR